MALVNVEEAKIFALAEPVTYSNPLVFALPIWTMLAPTLDSGVPLAEVKVSIKSTVLKASTSPETNPISGDPNTFVTLT